MSSATATLPTLKKVLFATDFSTYSKKALEYATALTRGLHGSFYLAHVVSTMNFALAGPETVGLAGDAAWRDLTELETKLDEAGALRGIPHHTLLCQGDISAQLQEIVEREGIDLVVVGTHGREGLMKVVAGSVAENVFRHVSCPVLVISSHVSSIGAAADTFAPKRVLLATDFGAASRQALIFGASLIKQNRGTLILLHVIPPLALTSADSFWYLGSKLEGMRKGIEVQTLEQLKKFIPEDLDLQGRVEFTTDVEFPVEGILSAARKHQADLILLGLREHAPSIASHSPWEIADRVICGADVPVMTVKA